MRNGTKMAWCGGVFLALLFVTCADAPAAPRRDAFEGKWAVEVTPDDGGKPYRDTLVFKGEKLTSQKMKKEGFEDAPYEVDLRGGQIGTFTATGKSKNNGTAKWTGTAATGNLQGTLAWTKKDGSTVNYAFTGARADK